MFASMVMKGGEEKKTGKSVLKKKLTKTDGKKMEVGKCNSYQKERK